MKRNIGYTIATNVNVVHVMSVAKKGNIIIKEIINGTSGRETRNMRW